MEQDRDRGGQNEQVRLIGISRANTSTTIETSKTIRKIMETLETYTNFTTLPDKEKAIVRDTVLNQINRLARIIQQRNTLIVQQ